MNERKKKRESNWRDAIGSLVPLVSNPKGFCVIRVVVLLFMLLLVLGQRKKTTDQGASTSCFRRCIH